MSTNSQPYKAEEGSASQVKKAQSPEDPRNRLEVRIYLPDSLG